MFNFNPFGIVRTAPDGTMTFAGAVTLVEMVQLVETVQSPELGGVQPKSVMFTVTGLLFEIPSLTISWKVNIVVVETEGAVKLGWTVFAPTSDTVGPAV